MLVHYGVRRTNGKSISQECSQVKMREAAHAFFTKGHITNLYAFVLFR